MAWRGGTQLVEQLLETTNAEQWREIAKRGSLEIVSHEKYRPKINEMLIQEISNSSHPISLYLKLKNNGGTVDSKKLIDAAMLLDQEDLSYKRQIFQEISELYPEELSITIIERALRGDKVPYTAWDFVKPSKKLNQKKMLDFCLQPAEEGRYHKPIKEISKLLTLKSVRRALKGYMQFQSLPREEQWQRHAELSPYRDILRNAKIECLIDAVLKFNARTVDEKIDLLYVLNHWQDPDLDLGSVNEYSPWPVTDKQKKKLTSLTQKITSGILKDAKCKRHDLAEIATAIARLRNPDLIPLLKELCDRDISRHAEQTLGLQNDFNHPEKDEARTCYQWTYRRAFLAFLPDQQAISIVTAYLNDPAFASEAAFALQKCAPSQILPERQNLGGYSFKGLSERQHRCQTDLSLKTEHPAALVILQKIGYYLSLNTQEGNRLASKLAHAAAWMDYGDNLPIFLRVLTLPQPQNPSYETVLGLIHSGEKIPVDIIERGLSKASEILKREWVPDNDWWQIKQWLELLAIVAPQKVRQAIAELPKQPQYYKLRDVASTIGHSPSTSEAIRALFDMADMMPSVRKEYQWIMAFRQIATEEAGMALLDYLQDPGNAQDFVQAISFPRDILSYFLREFDTIRKRAINLLQEKHAPMFEQIIVHAMSSIGENPSITDEDILPLLKSIGSFDSPLARNLPSITGEMVRYRQQSESSPQMIEIYPRAFEQSILQGLFEEAQGESAVSSVARLCLEEMMLVKYEYGFADNDLRHPYLEARKALPISAQIIWKGSFLPSETSNSSAARAVF